MIDALAGYANAWLFNLVPWCATYIVFFVTLYPHLDHPECILGAIPISITVSSWAVYLLAGLFHDVAGVSFAEGGTFTTTLVTLLFCAVIAVYYPQWKAKVMSRAEKGASLIPRLVHGLWQPQHRGLIAVCAAGFALFGYLLHTHILMRKGEGYYTGGACYGDMAFHLNLIRSFLHGENRHISLTALPKAPIYSGFSLVYPFIPDFNSAAVAAAATESVYDPVRVGLIVPSLLLAVSFVGLLYLINYYLFRTSQSVGVLAVILVIFGGGIGAFPYLWGDGEMSISKMISGVHIKNDLMERATDARPLFWFGMVAHILLPQRSALYAYPLVLFAFILLLRTQMMMRKNALSEKSCSETKEKKSNGAKENGAAESPVKTKGQNRTFERSALLLLNAVAGFSVSLLPLVQAHAFLGACVGAAWLALTTLPFWFSSRAYWEGWIAFGIPVIVVGFPQSMVYMKKATGQRFLRFISVWSNNSNEFGGGNPIQLWVEALGAFVPLAFVGMCLMSRTQIWFYSCFIAVFVLGNLVLLQPWSKDNLKIINIWVFVGAGVVANALVCMWKKPNVVLKLVVCVLFGSLVITGSIHVAREVNLEWEFYNTNDVAFAEYIKYNTPHDAVILTSDSHINVANSIAGRTVVYGYAGWLDSHGFPHQSRHRWLNPVWKDQPGALDQALKALDTTPTHVLIDPKWRHQFKDASATFNKHPRMKLMKKTRDFSLYEILAKARK
eukprot:TRINITY_DN5818_c0_g1_i2.p1 TRINITY_DN5818_c0_g1~~TRINITY_DN5818_c0_g1_i2.p1  ORF type:complete len:726 (+),score=126.40 TRINITY_DN5818_c0_g1_i2:173-2350(+)